MSPLTQINPKPAASDDLQTLVQREVASQLEQKLKELEPRLLEDRAALVVFSGELDKLLAGLVIATGAAAAGLQTSLFFTFWGLGALRKAEASKQDRSLKQKLFALMTPKGTTQLGTSKLNFMGAGSVMLRQMMKESDVSSLEEMVAMAQDLGVRFVACTMSMDVMGLSKEDLVDGVELGGVAAYLGDASGARLSLFI